METRIADNNGQPSSASAVPEEQTETTPTFVTITIHYLWNDPNDATEENVPLVEPYVANIRKGDPLSVSEPYPNRPGYVPTIDGMEQTASSYEREFTAEETVTDITIEVVYEKVPVPFYVRYFLQNVADDQYTERPDYSKRMQEKDVFWGYEGDEPNKEKIDISPYEPGFSSLFIQPDEIAADGSTVFAFYYDRNYYLMNFDLDGGYGTAPVYARYEAGFSVPNPEKPGYIFQGWSQIRENGVDLEDTDGDGKPGDADAEIPVDADKGYCTVTMPAKNTTYQAIWTTTDTTYTIVYWQGKADGDGYDYWGSESRNAQSGTSIDGYDSIAQETDATKRVSYNEAIGIDESRYFTFNGDISDKDVTIEGDGSSVVNVYYDRKEYTLKFYYAMETSEWKYVIGGSTYFFGTLATAGNVQVDTSDDVALLSAYMDSRNGERGAVNSIPGLNTIGESRGYTKGTEHATVGSVDYTYYYISFTARYGADISNLWPCNVFEPAERYQGNGDSGTRWQGMLAYASAWNGEHHVYYSQKNANQTIKGNYQKLDHQLLWDQQFGDSSEVAYLCFWENGTINTWNYPELWFYRLWVPVLEGEDTTGLILSEDGKYRLKEQYPTCDDSNLGGQTAVALEGFTYSGIRQVLENNLVAHADGQTNDLDNTPETKKVLVDYYTAIDPDFKEEDLKNYIRHYVVDFYYNRNAYELNFYSHNGYVKQEKAAYETSLAGCGFVPEYPADLEEKAYTFAGWYTSPKCLDGTEFGVPQYDAQGNCIGADFTGKTMPAANLTLYAKWKPVTHDVYFYKDFDLCEAGMFYRQESDVVHGQTIQMTNANFYIQNPDPATDPAFAEYAGSSFAGWFYMDNGVKTAFNPNEMEIRQEMHLFAEWKTSITTRYEISYVKAKLNASGEPEKDEDGNYIPDTSASGVLAQPTSDLIFTGTTKTFKAKGVSTGDGKLWLPHTNSHSILMKKPADYDDEGLPLAPEENQFSFCYVAKDFAPYQVQYLIAGTDDPVPGTTTKVVEDNKQAVVSELSVFVEGYMPTTAYATLVLSANDEENVIKFYYTKNAEPDPDEPDDTSEPFYYLVHHYIQNDDGTVDENGQYTDYGTFALHSTQSFVGNVGDQAEAKPLTTLSGYTYQSGFDQNGYQEVKTGTIISTDENGKPAMLELKLYYTRDPYPYIVQHLEYGTTNLVPQEALKEGDSNLLKGYLPYDAKLTANALEIPGYELVGGVDSKSLNIAIEELNAAEPEYNVIKFYYKPRQVEITYIPICKGAAIDIGKWLTFLSERPEGYTNIRGSTPYDIAGFTFEGWYKDADCTVPVTDQDGTVDPQTNEFVPEITAESAIGNDFQFKFYARFAPVTQKLTIQKSGAANTTDSFLFRVTCPEDALGNAVELTVAIQGNGSVTITDLCCGTYTVTELTDWSWTYGKAVQPQSTTLSVGRDGEVSFANTYADPDWLGGETSAENQFAAVTTP